MPSTHPRLKTLPADLFAGLQSFRELEERISALPDGSLLRGDALEIFVEAHLHTSPLFQVEELWLVNQIPLSVRRQLNLGDNNKGIDGVYRATDGTLVPYQVKFREGRPQVGVGDTASFFMLTEGLGQRMLISNSDRYSNDIRDRGNLQIVSGLHFDELAADDFTRVHSWLNNKPALPRRQRAMLPHQERAVAAILNQLRSETRALAVMPCGTGKTLVGLRAVEELKPRNVIVFVPSLALLAQLLGDWVKDRKWGKRFRYLCVCSEPAISAEVDRWEMDPKDVPFPVKTDPSLVRSFLEHEGDEDVVSVVFSTYHSAGKVAEGLPHGFSFDIGLFDEAHKTTEERFGLSLKDANLPISRRLFLTATPRHIDARRRNRDGDFDVVSMDNTAIYGQRAFRQSFAEAVEAEIICDYRVVVAIVDRSEISEHAERHGITLVQNDAKQFTWVATQIAVVKAIEETGAKKVITFHTMRKQAEHFASATSHGIKQFLPDFELGYVEGNQPVADRRDQLSCLYGSGKGLVSNAKCLTEGVDLPALDAVVFVNPRRSKVDIVQAVGRAMRKPPHSEKQFGYVVLPVLLERSQTEDLEEACRGTEWEDLVAVVAALRDHDSRLEEIIREAQEATGRGEVFNPRLFRDQITILGRPQIPLSIIQRHVSAVILERLGQTWDYRYGQLQAHKAERGHCDIPWDYHDKGLYDWITRQRIARKKDRLSDDQIARLDRIGFQWDPFGESFEELCNQLQRYKDLKGDCNVPARCKDFKWLGAKLAKLKEHYRKQDSLDERGRKLLSMGVVFDPLAEKFEKMFTRLAKHHELHGNCNVSNGSGENGDLLEWMGRIRGSKKKKRLSAGRIARLDALGFIWSPKEAAEAFWKQRVSEMAAYIAANGDSNVPLVYPANQEFANWWKNTRSSRNSGKLNKQKERELDALGVTWSLEDAKWNSMFQQLKVYKKQFGDCKVPNKYAENPKLGRWVGTQLYERRKNIKRRNTTKRLQKLASIGFWDDWAC